MYETPGAGVMWYHKIEKKIGIPNNRC